MWESIFANIGVVFVACIMVSMIFCSFAYMMHKITLFWEKIRYSHQSIGVMNCAHNIRLYSYWVAGFQDKIDPQFLLEELAKELDGGDPHVNMERVRSNSIQRTRGTNENNSQ